MIHRLTSQRQVEPPCKPILCCNSVYTSDCTIGHREHTCEIVHKFRAALGDIFESRGVEELMRQIVFQNHVSHFDDSLMSMRYCTN